MSKYTDNSAPSPVVPLIVRGDLAHYRFLARHGDLDTLRAVALVMADDLEEALNEMDRTARGRTMSG